MLVQALTTIVRRLDDAKARHLLDRYALVGGFAVSAWGVPCAMHDVDVALALGSADPAALSDVLQAEFHAGEPGDPLRGVFRTSIRIDDRSVPIRLILLPQVGSTPVVQGLTPLPVLDCAVPVVSWQTRVLLKVHDGGRQDLLDAQQVLAVSPAIACGKACHDCFG